MFYPFPRFDSDRTQEYNQLITPIKNSIENNRVY